MSRDSREASIPDDLFIGHLLPMIITFFVALAEVIDGASPIWLLAAPPVGWLVWRLAARLEREWIEQSKEQS